MRSAVDELVNGASWKLKMLVRTKRFYTDAELVMLYKAHLLAFIEYRSPAIYHCKRQVLKRLDHVQEKFLQDAGIDEAAALMHFNLAPLATRRDIAILGSIHRTVLQKGPPHFRQHFRFEGSRKLEDPRCTIGGQLIARSALGLIAVYNLLPQNLKEITQVESFQTGLQMLLKQRLEGGCADWKDTLSPRIPLSRHPLEVCM
jgi:hypothetical protein